MKVIFTGGHHNSALEVARKLREKDPSMNHLWIGHKYTMLGDRAMSVEYKEVSKGGFEFKELKAGKLYKTFHPLHWLRLPYGLLQALYYVWRFKPNLIVSFGGYLAAPVVIAGWILRVPSITHEQTTTVGLANRLIARFADKILITWPQSEKYFNPARTLLTGLPLRQCLFESREDIFQFNNRLPTIFVTGGKQGSHIINEVLSEALDDLLQVANIIHQTGSHSVTNDLSKAQKQWEALPADLKDRYLVKGYFFEDEIGSVYKAADLLISRAGAHTVYELAALGKPALLIPIPWSSHNEQYRNARILLDEGTVQILAEDRLTPETLKEEARRMLKNLSRYQSRGEQVKKLVRFDAADMIVAEILKYT